MATTPTALGGGGASTATTDVAGAAGAPAPPTAVDGVTGGGATNLAPIIEQLNAALAALQQAIQGGGLLGGGPGGADSGCGMPTCDMGAMPPAPPAAEPVQQTPDQTGEAKGDKGKGKGEAKGDKGEAKGKKDKPADKPANKPDQKRETAGGGGTQGADAAPETPPADPNAARRTELQTNIREARAELDRITAKMDTLAAEKQRLESASSEGSSINAIEHRTKRINEIRAEINGLRSAGSYISQSIPIWQKELNGLG